MRCFERGRKKDDAAGVVRDALEGGSEGGGRRGPAEENRFHAVERRVERLWKGQIGCDDLNRRWQGRRFGRAGERANIGPGGEKLRDYGAADRAGGADHEHTAHSTEFTGK